MNIKKEFELQYDTANANLIYNNANILYYKDNHWYINNIDTGVTTATIAPAETQQTINYGELNKATFGEAFGLLDQKINNLQKDLTYWDIFRIREQITDNEDTEAKFTALAPGESLIFNKTYTEEIKSLDEKTYVLSRGDVLIKTLDETAVLVKAINQGMYYPSQIIKNEDDSYTITYAFDTSAPVEGTVAEIAVDDEDPLEQPAKQIKATGFEDPVMAQPYSIYKALSSNPITFPQIIVDNIPITPIIKFFTGDYEEIYCDYTLGTDNGDN